jgi:hypothetical protein
VGVELTASRTTITPSRLTKSILRAETGMMELVVIRLMLMHLVFTFMIWDWHRLGIESCSTSVGDRVVCCFGYGNNGEEKILSDSGGRTSFYILNGQSVR